MIITVSGLAGTGTTSVCKLLRDKLDYAYIYAGAIFRFDAQQKNMSIAEFLQSTGASIEYNKYVDSKMVEFAETYENSIVEGRAAAWMIHQAKLPALKVLFKAPLEISAQRVSQRDGITYATAFERVQKRDNADKERFKKLYDIDLDDETIYDLIFDTTKYTIIEEAQMIIDML